MNEVFMTLPASTEFYVCGGILGIKLCPGLLEVGPKSTVLAESITVLVFEAETSAAAMAVYPGWQARGE